MKKTFLDDTKGILVILIMSLFCVQAFGQVAPYSTADSSAHISFTQAWDHVTSTGSWWISLLVVIALEILAIVLLVKLSKHTEIPDWAKGIALFVLLVALAAAIFCRALDVEYNTSVDALSRGHYLGY